MTGPPASWITTVALPILTLLAGVVVARVTAKGTQRVTEIERELPPYEALANRASGLEKLIHAMEKEARENWRSYDERTKQLETAVTELRDTLDEDRDWIKQAVVVAERRGATTHIEPLPAWIDLDSDSMRQRRRRLRLADEDDPGNTNP